MTLIPDETDLEILEGVHPLILEGSAFVSNTKDGMDECLHVETLTFMPLFLPDQVFTRYKKS